MTPVGPFWEGYHESRRCSKDTYPETYIALNLSGVLIERGVGGTAAALTGAHAQVMSHPLFALPP